MQNIAKIRIAKSEFLWKFGAKIFVQEEFENKWLSFNF